MKKLKNIIITGVLLIVFVFSAYKITTKFYTDIRAESTYSSLKAKNEKRDTDDGEDLKEDLSNLNKDFKFWITIDNTDVEYPVLQAKDNDYYLKRDINKKSTAAGSIFLDYRDDADSSQNLILYGHNMKNGTMFAAVNKFKDKDFWDKNSKIRVYKGAHEYVYEVYAVCAVDADKFDYLSVDFENEKDFLAYVKSVTDRAVYKSDTKIKGDDKIITLSTCSYEFENGRTFIQGKLVEVN